MSEVTNLILVFSIEENEEERIVEVNSFEYGGIQMNFVSADFEKGKAWYGGTKFLETPLYIGAFNHFDLNSFILHLKQIQWVKPECIQLFAKGQWDEKFRVIEIV